MPELPDITIYIEALEHRLTGRRLAEARFRSPFLLRTAVPNIREIHGRRVIGFRRIGKRIAFGFENELWLVFHLMIAGRFHWQPLESEKVLSSRKNVDAALTFENGMLTLTEAGTRKRASVHLVSGERGLSELAPGGIEVGTSTLDAFAAALTRSNHTLKRALTDPRILSGIGNAYSDEILHVARLSPLGLTQKLVPDEIEGLYHATQTTLAKWVELLRGEAAGKFPENVTAFRPQMAVHGKYGSRCPRCGAKVQRIRYASNETNYCPRCQTGGRLLADRALSLLLKKDWPQTPEEMEELRRGKREDI